MSDDIWKSDRSDEKPRKEFGEDWDLDEPSFDDSLEMAAPGAMRDPDDVSPPPVVAGFDDDFTDGLPPLKFGDDDSSALPHWNEPPTGELPSMFSDPDPSADLDVWSSFSGPADSSSQLGTNNPWATPDDATTVEGIDFGDMPKLGALDESPAPDNMFFEEDETAGLVQPAKPQKPARGPIQIGTDPTKDPLPPPERPRRVGQRPAAKGPGRPEASPAPAGFGGRNMPMAIAVGLGLAVVFFGLIKVGPVAVLAFIVAVLVLGAVEFHDKTFERGYRPIRAVLMAACALMPIAAYTHGTDGVLVCVVLSFVAAVVAAMTNEGIESGPLPNTAITMVGICWIGMFGAFGGLILKLGNDLKDASGGALAHVGTDTLVYMVVGVVATDVGALFVGSLIGKRPLRRWISPNKTIEGLIGGVAFTIIALFITKVIVGDKASTWFTTTNIVILAVVIALLAPIGDLAESMFKRNLDIKDFGTLVPGHGGVLDRFDGFLFVLPAVYYLLVTLEPWTAPLTKK